MICLRLGFSADGVARRPYQWAPGVNDLLALSARILINGRYSAARSLGMKAIAVEFTPVWGGWAPPEKVPTAGPNGNARMKAGSDTPNPNVPQFSDGDYGTPPFWTWFVENPRRCRI